MDCGQWAGEAVITTDVSQTVGLTGGVKREKKRPVADWTSGRE